MTLAALMSGVADAELIDCAPAQAATVEALSGEVEALLVGESHGTVEMPAMLVEIVKASLLEDRGVVVALEFPSAWQSDFDRMIEASTKEEAEAILSERQTPDGRTSGAMRTMLLDLVMLTKANPNLSIAAADINLLGERRDWQVPDWWPESVNFERSVRDYAMGENALKACRQAGCDLLIYYAGNFHVSAVGRMGGSLDVRTGEVTEFEVLPSGAVIAREKKTASIYLTHEGGASTAMRATGFGQSAMTPNTPDYVEERGLAYCADGSAYFSHFLNVGPVSSSADPYADSGDDGG